VDLVWFRFRKSDRQHLYADLTENYDPTRRKPSDTSRGDSPPEFMDAEAHVAELFTEEDAKQLKTYLDRNRDDPNTISEAKLPILQNTIGFGAIPVRGGWDCLMYERFGHPLSFR
jgi:hypothetical protein